jgi:glycosyltransferase involved in cell wall biosynthesis
MAVMPDQSPLKILHVFRSPVGGLFRHVVDLVEGQSARGHQVGMVLDSKTGGIHADTTLARIAERCKLGITRIPMDRHIGLRDLQAVFHVSRRIAQTQPDIVHGHGAKGAAYARLAAKSRAITVCTPHGGSLHYDTRSPVGLLYITLEKVLRRRTDLFLFESDFAERSFRTLIGDPNAMVKVVRNGVAESEFAEVALEADATDLLFIGELRDLKGVDVLLDAVAISRQASMPLSVTIVGDGPARHALHRQAERLGLTGAVRFKAPMPARKAFALGRIVVVPSRKESLPYIILEIAAAGKPLIATNVGGIPEIFGPQSDLLIPAGDSAALANTLMQYVNHPETIVASSRLLQTRIRTNFSLANMVEDGIRAYRAAIAAGKS